MALYWAIFLFGLAMLIRHGKRLAHDFGYILPNAFRGTPFIVLGIAALVVAPLSAGVGLVLMSLAWCVFLFPYLDLFHALFHALFHYPLVDLSYL